MSFRFRKSIKIVPGVHLNLSRRGVTATLGPRGLNVNVGRSGSYLNASVPGTGLSSRRRLGDGGGGGGGHSGGGTGGGAAGGGCLGAGVAGFLMLSLVGMCMGSPEPSDRGTSSLSSYAALHPTTDSLPAYNGARDAFYIHAPMNVRSEPRASGARVRTLHRGDRVELGPKDPNGWAPYVDHSGKRVGYVYRASENVRRSAPRFPNPYAASSGNTGSSGSRISPRRSSAESRGYYTGPRGGCYTYSASGRKRYVDRSYCN